MNVTGRRRTRRVANPVPSEDTHLTIGVIIFVVLHVVLALLYYFKPDGTGERRRVAFDSEYESYFLLHLQPHRRTLNTHYKVVL